MRCRGKSGACCGHTLGSGEAYRREKIEDFGVMFVRGMLQRRHDGNLPCTSEKQGLDGAGGLGAGEGEVPFLVPGFDGW